MKAFPLLAARVFGAPLAIEQKKLEVIVNVVGPRLAGFSYDDDDDDEEDDTSGGGFTVTDDGVAIIDISGTLVSKSSGMNALSGLTSYQDLRSSLQTALDDPAVCGIVLAIDSPGGEVAGLFDLADWLYSARGSKPIVASVDCAASAAYLLASCADEVYVSRAATTGSIGIICLHLDRSAADAQNGLKYSAIYAGARKNDGNPHEPLNDDARTALQARVDQMNDLFVTDVARNRGLAPAAVLKMDAGVFLGTAGIEAGLADQVGTIDDAIAAAADPMTSAASAANSMKGKQRMTTKTADAANAAEALKKLEAAHAEGIAYAASIIDLCALAGKPDAAAGFIQAKKTQDEVRADLLAQKVKEQADGLNTASLPGGKSGAGVETPQGKARPWRDVLGAMVGLKRQAS